MLVTWNVVSGRAIVFACAFDLCVRSVGPLLMRMMLRSGRSMPMLGKMV